jgi:hypothetical protein
MEKNAYLKKIENIANENKLERKKRMLNEKFIEAKKEKEKITDNLIQIQKDIESYKAEIEVLENYNKFTEGLSTSSSLKKFEQLKHSKKHSSEEKEKLFFAASQVQKDKYKRERDVIHYREEIENKLKLKDKLKIKEEELIAKVKMISSDLDLVKNELMLHYHSLLNEGKDTRTEGLVWIIKAIWNLGCEVIISYFPTFLDEKCIDYLFTVAHKDFELQKLKEHLDEMKQNLKKSIHSEKANRKAKKQSTFKTNLEV